MNCDVNESYIGTIKTRYVVSTAAVAHLSDIIDMILSVLLVLSICLRFPVLPDTVGAMLLICECAAHTIGTYRFAICVPSGT